MTIGSYGKHTRIRACMFILMWTHGVKLIGQEKELNKIPVFTNSKR